MLSDFALDLANLLLQKTSYNVQHENVYFGLAISKSVSVACCILRTVN